MSFHGSMEFADYMIRIVRVDFSNDHRRVLFQWLVTEDNEKAEHRIVQLWQKSTLICDVKSKHKVPHYSPYGLMGQCLYIKSQFPRNMEAAVIVHLASWPADEIYCLHVEADAAMWASAQLKRAPVLSHDALERIARKRKLI
jgi:hypothetical protein